MSALHTPGPWEFRVYAGGCTIVSKHDAPGRSVRDWLKGVEIKVEAQIDDDQGNAHEASPDARLIAAAPELLAAAETVLAGLNARIDAAPLGSAPVFTGIAGLSDAINKARGEA